MAYFRDLAPGDIFDWVSHNASWNSFYQRCEKISVRKYRSEDGTVHRVGSINAVVYHIGGRARLGHRR